MEGWRLVPAPLADNAIIDVSDVLEQGGLLTLVADTLAASSSGPVEPTFKDYLEHIPLTGGDWSSIAPKVKKPKVGVGGVWVVVVDDCVDP